MTLAPCRGICSFQQTGRFNTEGMWDAASPPLPDTVGRVGGGGGPLSARESPHLSQEGRLLWGLGRK